MPQKIATISGHRYIPNLYSLRVHIQRGREINMKKSRYSLRGIVKGGQPINEEDIDEAIDAFNLVKIKVSDLPESEISRIKELSYDHFDEGKHETGSWEYAIDEAEFIVIANRNVLLPIDKKHHKNLTILRDILSADKNSITVFFNNSTYEAEDGYIAFCDKVPGQNYYIATLLHGCFLFLIKNK
jgi:hypothetical protein